MKKIISILLTAAMLLGCLPAISFAAGAPETLSHVYFADDFERSAAGAALATSKGLTTVWNFVKGEFGGDTSVGVENVGGSNVLRFARKAGVTGNGGPYVDKYIEYDDLKEQMMVEFDLENSGGTRLALRFTDAVGAWMYLYWGEGKSFSGKITTVINFADRTFTTYADGKVDTKGVIPKTYDLASSYTKFAFYANVKPGESVTVDNVVISDNGVELPKELRGAGKKDASFLTAIAKNQTAIGKTDITQSNSYKNSLEYKVFTDDFSSYTEDTVIPTGSATNQWNSASGTDEKPTHIEKVKGNDVLMYAISPDVASGGPYVRKRIPIADKNSKLKINFELYNFGRGFTVAVANSADTKNRFIVANSKEAGINSADVEIEIDFATRAVKVSPSSIAAEVRLPDTMSLDGELELTFQVISFKAGDFCYIDNVVISSDNAAFDTEPKNVFKNYSGGNTEILSLFREGHPKIWFNSDFSFADAKKRIDSDAQLTEWYNSLKARADSVLKSGLVEYPTGADRTPYLKWARSCWNNIAGLAFCANTENNTAYKDAAVAQMYDLINHPDWFVGSALAISEGSMGLILGYDWLYNMLTEEERTFIEEGLIREGAGRMLNGYNGTDVSAILNDAGNNRGSVHAGASMLAGIALSDKYPGGASFLIEQSAKIWPKTMDSYEPDGAWFEGSGYWLLATRYAVFCAQGLKTALKDSKNIPDWLKFYNRNGFSKTSEFIIYMNTPRGGAFNFGDSDDAAISTGPHGWFAKEFNKPSYAAYQYNTFDKYPSEAGYLSNLIFKILTYDPEITDASNFSGFALAKMFKADEQKTAAGGETVEAITMRSSWLNPNASFIGLQGGGNFVGHGEYSLGQFCIESDQTRWIRLNELRTNYDWPLARTEYYQSRPEGHNVIVFNPDSSLGQDITGTATCERMETNGYGSLGTINLKNAYTQYVDSYVRGIRLDNDTGNMYVQDDVKGKQAFTGGYAFYHLHSDVTGVSLSEDGKTAYLTDKKGAALIAKIADGSFEGAKFILMDSKPLPNSPDPVHDDEIDYGKKLAVDITGQKDFSLGVEFIPTDKACADAKSVFTVSPIESWTLSGTGNMKDELASSTALMMNSPVIYVNGELKVMDESDLTVTPYEKNARTMVPVRFISEALGAEVGWDSATESISISLGQRNILCRVNSDTMTVNGETITIDAPVEMKGDRTFIPLRAISEALEKIVFWDDRGLIIAGDKQYDAANNANMINSIIQKLQYSLYVNGERINSFDAAGASVFSDGEAQIKLVNHSTGEEFAASCAAGSFVTLGGFEIKVFKKTA